MSQAPPTNKVELNKNIASIQIAPNPCSHIMTISISPNNPTVLSVLVMDELGKQVSKIYSGLISPGAHSFDWIIGGQIPNGCYECIIQMNNISVALPVILSR